MTHSRFYPSSQQELCHKLEMFSKAKAPNLVRLMRLLSSVLAYILENYQTFLIFALCLQSYTKGKICILRFRIILACDLRYFCNNRQFQTQKAPQIRSNHHHYNMDFHLNLRKKLFSKTNILKKVESISICMYASVCKCEVDTMSS